MKLEAEKKPDQVPPAPAQPESAEMDLRFKRLKLLADIKEQIKIENNGVSVESYIKLLQARTPDLPKGYKEFLEVDPETGFMNIAIVFDNGDTEHVGVLDEAKIAELAAGIKGDEKFKELLKAENKAIRETAEERALAWEKAA